MGPLRITALLCASALLVLALPVWSRPTHHDGHLRSMADGVDEFMACGKDKGCCKEGYICALMHNANGYSRCLSGGKCSSERYDCNRDACGNPKNQDMDLRDEVGGGRWVALDFEGETGRFDTQDSKFDSESSEMWLEESDDAEEELAETGDAEDEFEESDDTEDEFEESNDTEEEFGESDDTEEESDDTEEEFDDTEEESDDTEEEFGESDDTEEEFESEEASGGNWPSQEFQSCKNNGFCCGGGLNCYKYKNPRDGGEDWQCMKPESCWASSKGWECWNPLKCNGGGGGGSGNCPSQEFQSCKNNGYCCSGGLSCYKYQNPRDGGIDYQCMTQQSCWASGEGWQCWAPIKSRGDGAKHDRTGDNRRDHRRDNRRDQAVHARTGGKHADCSTDYCCADGYKCFKWSEMQGSFESKKFECLTYDDCLENKKGSKFWVCDQYYPCKKDSSRRDDQRVAAKKHHMQDQAARTGGMSAPPALGEWARCGWNGDAFKEEGCCKAGWICAVQKNNEGRYSQCQPADKCDAQQFECGKNACGANSFQQPNTNFVPGGGGALAGWARCGWNGDAKKEEGCCAAGWICAVQKNNGGYYSQCQPEKKCDDKAFDCTKNACKPAAKDYRRDTHMRSMSLGVEEFMPCGKGKGCCKDNHICALMHNSNGYSRCIHKDKCTSQRYDCNRDKCGKKGGHQHGKHPSGTLEKWARCGWNADSFKEEGCCKEGLICAVQKNNGGRYSQCQPKEGCDSNGFECGKNACGKDSAHQANEKFVQGGGGSLEGWARCGWNADARKEEGCCKAGWICAVQKNNGGRYSQCQPEKKCDANGFDCGKNACKANKDYRRDGRVHVHSAPLRQQYENCGKGAGCCTEYNSQGEKVYCFKQNDSYSQCNTAQECKRSNGFNCDPAQGTCGW